MLRQHLRQKDLEQPVLREWTEQNAVTDKRVNIYGTVLRDETTGGFQMWYADAG